MPGTIPIADLDSVSVADFRALYSLAIELAEAEAAAFKGENS